MPRPPSSARRRLRSLFLVTHRWFGLTAGFYYVLLGLSGAYLVYAETFESWLVPARYRSAGAVEAIDLGRAVAVARGVLELPESAQPVNAVIPASLRDNLSVTFNLAPAGKRAKYMGVWVDPAGYLPRGAGTFRESLAGQLFIFHHELYLGGRIGRPVVAVAGIVMLFLLFSGLYLWWPKPGAWRRHLLWPTIKNWFHFHLELHKLSGFYSLLLMVVVTFSGIYIAVPGWFEGGRRQQTPAEEKKTLPVDYAKLTEELAARGLPLRGQLLVFEEEEVEVYAGDGRRFSLRKTDFSLMPEDAGAYAGRASMRELQHDLHAGAFWGRLGKALVFLSGFLPLLFYVTGFYVWWKKRGRKKPARAPLAA